MKQLATEFTHYGRTLRQLKRTRTAAIYELIGAQKLLYGYEVIRIRERKQRELFGRRMEEHEVYPSDSDFGRIGWSFGRNYRKEAFERYTKLVLLEEHERPNAHGPSALERALLKEQLACD
jgi:hypothetical protein